MASKQARHLASRIIQDAGHKTNRFAEERGHARHMDQPEPHPVPSGMVYRLTADYVPFMKHNRQVDYEKVHYQL